jgi:hypothetical protein
MTEEKTMNEQNQGQQQGKVAGLGDTWQDVAGTHPSWASVKKVTVPAAEK